MESLPSTWNNKLSCKSNDCWKVVIESEVLLVELHMMKQRLEHTDACCRIRWSHREQTSFWDKHINSNLKTSTNKIIFFFQALFWWVYRYLENATCWFPEELEDLHLQEGATAQLCGHTVKYIGRKGHIKSKSFSLLISETVASTHPKSSFWLRDIQVSGKQAMFPRIPTQIS